MRKLLLFFVIALLAPLTVLAQELVVSGKVTDNHHLEVVGASIMEKGTQNGTITNFDGDYSLKLQNKNAVLVISFIGYKTQEIAVNGRSSINVVLQEDSELLDEVVVTGYGGSQRRATLTTAISKLDDQVLQTAAFSNIAQSLQGTVTGLRVSNTSGQPGSEPNIVLRGGATISGSNNGALIVVDGVVRESMQGISSDDIESIQVLKDAASTAIYGARANGGVILIETKKGKSGSAFVNYKFKLGTNFARYGYDYLNAEDYIYYNRLGVKRYNDAGGNYNVDRAQGYGVTGNNLFDIQYLSDSNRELLNQGWQQMVDPYDESRSLVYRDHSGKLNDAIFNNRAITQEHNINFSGGNEYGAFSAKFGYFHEDGIVKNTGYKRFTGSINGHYKVLPFLTVNGGASYSWQRQPSLWIGESALFYRTRAQRPTWNPYLEDGSPASGFGTGDGNPEYYMDKLTSINGLRRQTYNVGFKLELVPKQLFFEGNASLYHYDYQYESFTKEYKVQSSSNSVTTRAASAQYRKRNQIQVSAFLNYKNVFAEAHELDVRLGGEYFDFHQFDLSASTTGSPTDDIPTLNAGSERTATSSEKTGYRIWSGIGRANYNYKTRYLFSLVGRYDGISRLINNRWGFFPGASAGWNVTEEEFWKDSSVSNVISNLKPRISYGVNGNVSGLGNFSAFGLYGQSTDYDGNTGFYNSGLINSDLRWEKSKTLEVGLDFSFFNNRLAFILDYYDRRTEDLLTSLSLPSYTGFNSITTNLGTLKNYGVELEIRANIINTRDFSWDMTANISSVANKILKLPYNGNENNRQGGVQVWDPKRNELKWIGSTQEGGKLGDMFGYKQISVFRDWDDVWEHAANRIDNIANLYGPGLADEYAGKTGWKPIEPGDVNWSDLDGNDIIDGLDREILGNIFPKVVGGFSTTFKYKGLSLYARFDFAVGHTIYNDQLARSLGQYQGTFNIIDVVKQSWSEDNRDTDIAKFYYADQLAKKNFTRSANAGTTYNNNGSRFYEKGDYCALRDLTLSYLLPSKWTKKAFMDEVSVYVTGQNLFYMTKYTGSNPEPPLNSTIGIDYGRYPVPRTLLFGLSVTF